MIKDSHGCAMVPAKHIGASNIVTKPNKRLYTCPMHPEIRRDQPGSCPKCGMALEPVMPDVPSKTDWTCPMHPEIVRDGPGACPICGMALEPRTALAEE